MEEADYLMPKTIKIPIDLWEEIKKSGYASHGKFSEFARGALKEYLVAIERQKGQKQEPPKQ